MPCPPPPWRPRTAKALLSTYYVDQIPEEVLEQGSVDAIIESLGDPYTVYMTAEEYQSFLSSVNGSTVVGVGVSISNLDSVEEGVGIEILSVLDNSPALEAGLSAGDYILAADGVALTSGTDASARIQGEPGTSVTLTIRFHDTGEVRDVTLERRAVLIPIVTYDLVDGEVGYIDCDSFGASTADTVEEALTQLKEQADLWVMTCAPTPVEPTSR